MSQLQTRLWVRECSTITVGLSQLYVSNGWFGVCAHTLTQTTADVAPPLEIWEELELGICCHILDSKISFSLL